MYKLVCLTLLMSSNVLAKCNHNQESIPTKSFSLNPQPLFATALVRPQRPYFPDDTGLEKAWKSFESGIYTLIEAIPSWIAIALIYIGVYKANNYLNQEGH